MPVLKEVPLLEAISLSEDAVALLRYRIKKWPMCVF